MRKNSSANLCAFLCLFIFFLYGSHAQVGINTTTPADGALLDVSSSNKGFLMPRVELTGTNDVTTITPSATTGLLVYNTVTAGPLATQVTPGFYYWSGVQWRRLYNQGYTLKYDQTSEARASALSTVYTNLPGLNTGTITVPFSGTYQIIIHGFYAAGNLISNSYDGAAQGSISLAVSENGGALSTLKEAYVTTTSKSVNGTVVNNLAQSVTILVNIDLDVTKTYRFQVRGREWKTNNVSRGYYGKNTSSYSGASSVNDAQRGTMSISLIKQF
ncbi:hypothetical protein [Cochleicola gelatinilyticus]|uniref:Uncharacterized protein n=1 Tax=Cochleicola gelatinilyticus TaxID=1763537 RepID=A0A167IIG6_9FLAO|nr:hypothetical protein [Cochleicola gelatinilyticus]OAB79684.1 hypothetical protein ULVI_02755 [Cochleicola gelatinilyticus]